eukprot:gb/GFBE01036424.1/.p1 GENE.gb/GFBE01036424.1/~~gb/GFBE01036424.1/.p1  ORF type:complete len:203 (+),score=31.93 gb/GFBE01036424.1/:1-609(+)
MAKQPGATTAALQYLVSSTSGALNVAANVEVAATASEAALASAHSSSSLAGNGGMIGAGSSGSSSALLAPAAGRGAMYWASQGGMAAQPGAAAAAAVSRSSSSSGAGGRVVSVNQQKENRQNERSQLGELLGATFIPMPGPSVGHHSMPQRLDLQQPHSARMASSLQPQAHPAHNMPQHYHQFVPQADPGTARGHLAPRQGR